MFVETIKSDGLAHLSYLIGNAGQAAVIDPRRDCETLCRAGAARGCRITHIFETHRNEDLVSGAPILAELTGAPVHHGPNAAGEVVYARTRCGRAMSFRLGALRIEVPETPGHTDDSLSFVLYDTDFGDEAVGVFTGDALFVGDVGRTDFYPDRAAEVAGLLFDSLRRIVALGDQAIIYPAHGAGSVCGDMADPRVLDGRLRTPRQSDAADRRSRRVHRQKTRRTPRPAALFPAHGASQPRRRSARRPHDHAAGARHGRLRAQSRRRDGRRCPRHHGFPRRACSGQSRHSRRHRAGLCLMAARSRRSAGAGRERCGSGGNCGTAPRADRRRPGRRLPAGPSSWAAAGRLPLPRGGQPRSGGRPCADPRAGRSTCATSETPRRG